MRRILQDEGRALGEVWRHATGPAPAGEYSGVNLGVLSAGTHYIQVLREDHGGVTGWTMAIEDTAVPEPASLLLLGAGLALVASRARRRK